jgi:SAM-dependent methyltransferase
MNKVITNFPIAFDSPDHLFPTATINDNGGSNFAFVKELEDYLGRKIKILDLGCAGGQNVVDFYLNGNYAIGLEGSDAGVKLHNWPEWKDDILFTCDITRPFYIKRDGEKVLFDVITCWEVMEHLDNSEFNGLFTNVYDNLLDYGLFVGSVGLASNINLATGHQDHRTLISASDWDEKFSQYFKVIGYPFQNAIRTGYSSHNFGLRKKL